MIECNISWTFLLKKKNPKIVFKGNTFDCLQMALYSKRIDSSTRISSTPLCPPLISHVCTNPLVFVYIIGVLLFTICFILGFILNRAYRQSKYDLYQWSVRYDYYKAKQIADLKCQRLECHIKYYTQSVLNITPLEHGL